jgi:hypothetical protein
MLKHFQGTLHLCEGCLASGYMSRVTWLFLVLFQGVTGFGERAFNLFLNPV